MPDTGQVLAAIAIFFLVQAVASAAYGMNLARRAGRPAWHGLLAGGLLPWFGLLFIPRRPAGQERATGFAHYAMSMLFIAAAMAVISMFIPWGTYYGGAAAAEVSVEPVVLLPVALIVAALCLGGALGMLFGSGVGLALAMSIALSGMTGLGVASYYLVRDLTVLTRLEEGEYVFRPGGGFWVLVVAVIVGYLSLVVAPFGLKLDPLPVPEPPPPPAPPPQAASNQPWPNQRQPGAGQPPQHWGSSSQQGQTW